MYISELRLWNFRKFWNTTREKIDNSTNPDLVVKFNKWLNLLIGLNDSWKTAIIDALKIVLKTYTSDWIKIEKEDFTNDTNELRIECIIKSKFENEEDTILWARWFTEHISFETDWNPYLRLILHVRKDSNWKILPYELKAWSDFNWYILYAEAKDKIKCTYLKALRDAENELIPKKWSRLSQILDGHNIFENKNNHNFIQKFQEINEYIKSYFTTWNDWYLINNCINEYLSAFYWETITVPFSVNDPNLKNILELLKLAYEETKKWLWNQNLLFIATELLHLRNDNKECLKLWLIEEIEAHIHPQSQMRVIEKLQKDSSTNSVQLILSSHSPNIWSKVKLENIILCTEKWVFNLDSASTKLSPTDYPFLERFLDTTKANLFFAKWIILVEWWWEELILPTLAKKLWFDLTAKWVSIINIWNTAHLRYAKIFWRIDWKNIWIPVSVITDLDVKPAEISTKWESEKQKKEDKFKDISTDVNVFISPSRTLEYCIATSIKLKPLLLKAICLAQIDKKEDDIVSWKIKSSSRLAEIENINFDEINDKTAEEIYKQISDWIQLHENLYSEKVSKSILAQHFATLLENQNESFFTELHQEINTVWNSHWIKYLLNAIEHACNN